MNLNALFTGILALGLITACNSDNKHENPAAVSNPVKAETTKPESKARLAIYVTKDGRIFLNDKSTNLKELEEALKQHKLKGGMVFYCVMTGSRILLR